MKKMVSFRLSPEMIERVERISRATRIKKTTILEMCIEMDLPRLEERYARELKDLEGKQAQTSASRSNSPAKKEDTADSFLGKLKENLSERAKGGGAHHKSRQ
jgi:predicted DNA-binding protein